MELCRYYFGKTGIDMSGSTIAIIYGVVLTIFFILLVVLTITLLVSKSKKGEDSYDDSIFDAEETSYDEYNSSGQDNDSTDVWYSENNAQIPDIPIDNSYESAFDSAFADVEPQNNDTQDVADSVFDSAFAGISEETEATSDGEAPEQSADTEIVKDSDSPQQSVDTEEVADSALTDSAFADSAFTDSAFADSAFADSAFADGAFAENTVGSNTSEHQMSTEELDESIKEAENLRQELINAKIPGVGYDNTPERKKLTSTVPSNADFYWFNKMDVKERPSYKTEEMYHHHFNTAKDCIEDLLMEMYDCALVRTEEIKYIAYGIEPRAVSMKEILNSGNRNYTTQVRLKEPSTQDLVRIYEKWCGYVDKLFDKVYIHADEYTINEIRDLLYEFGRSDVDVLIEGM